MSKFYIKKDKLDTLDTIAAKGDKKDDYLELNIIEEKEPGYERVEQEQESVVEEGQPKD